MQKLENHERKTENYERIRMRIIRKKTREVRP
jgi:hypothetical protein